MTTIVTLQPNVLQVFVAASSLYVWSNHNYSNYAKILQSYAMHTKILDSMLEKEAVLPSLASFCLHIPASEQQNLLNYLLSMTNIFMVY